MPAPSKHWAGSDEPQRFQSVSLSQGAGFLSDHRVFLRSCDAGTVRSLNICEAAQIDPALAHEDTAHKNSEKTLLLQKYTMRANRFQPQTIQIFL